MDLQAFFDGLSVQWKEERARTQMTLGSLIARLSELDQDLEMDGVHEAHSYRGYYTDLAFEQCDKRKVADVLAKVKESKGETYIGYKGGEFDMGNSTPVWIANYGSCGLKIMSITDEGVILTAEDE
jgi:hypothetical protein